MFARDGGGAGDDPYNFDISHSFSNRDTKKKGSEKTVGSKLSSERSVQSRLGKSSLNKTVRPDPKSSPLKRQESTLSTAVNVSKNTLRVPTPNPNSALDKAMGFLNKYKQGNSTTPSTSAATGASAFRRSGTANASFDDEDGMDMSMSSDDDYASRKFNRKIESRLKVGGSSTSVQQLTEKVEAFTEDLGIRSLTGVHSSARFTRAKDIGITEYGRLARPKAAVSPVGLPERYIRDGITMGEKTQSEIRSQSENRKSGLRLAVSIPGSPQTDVTGQEHGSNGDSNSVESTDSTVTGSLEDTRQGEGAVEIRRRQEDVCSDLDNSYEIIGEGSSSLISPTLELETGLLKNAKEDDIIQKLSRGASDTGIAHNHPREAFGNVLDFGDLGAVSDKHVEPVPMSKSNAAENGSNHDIQTEYHHWNQAIQETVGQDEDDDYGDDDFEELDGVLEGDSRELVGHDLGGLDPAVSGRIKYLEEARVLPKRSHIVDERQLLNDEQQNQNTSSTSTSTVSTAPVVDYSNDRKGRTSDEPCHAWIEPSATSLKLQVNDIGTNSKSGTSRDKKSNHEAIPDSSMNGRGVQSSPSTKKAWDGKPIGVPQLGSGDICRGPKPTAVAEDGAPGPTFGDYNQYQTQGGTEHCKGWATTVGGGSRRSVVIDRSSEVHSPERQPGTDVKVVVRPEAVASVEYAHDPESGLYFRSFGTQAVGSSAAVQADITVPGMVGTKSSVDTDFKTRRGQKNGVRYRSGEPYAKWGRFPCEISGYYSSGRDLGGASTARGAATVGHSCSTASRRRPRSSMGIANAGENENRNVIVGGASSTDGSGGAGGHPQWSTNEVNRPKDGEGMDSASASLLATSKIPLVGAPAYLQMFLDAMTKSQAESCSAWQHVIEETARPQGLLSSQDYEPSLEERNRTADGADSAQDFRGDTGNTGDERWADPREAEFDTYGVMAATQDSFRRQLLGMRENLQKIRYRAEVAGRQGCAHNYETLSSAREFIASIKPRPTSQAEALMRVDPSLTAVEAAAQAQGDFTAPSLPTESNTVLWRKHPEDS